MSAVPHTYRLRLRLFIGIVLLILAVLAGRLVQMQLLDEPKYAAEARDNAVRARTVLPPRGRVYDRSGVLLVDNADAFTVTATPYHIDTTRVGALAALLGRSDSLVSARLRAARRYDPFATTPLVTGLSVDEIGRLEEGLYRFPGVAVVEDHRRRYPSGVPAPFAYGTVGEIGPEELAERRAAGASYRLGDIVGRTGAERAYEEELRGRPGTVYEEVDVRGRVRGPWKGGAEDEPPVAGFDLTLGLDADLQVFAESLFVNKRGAAVALDPQTGEILAYVSAPDFDSSDLVPPIEPAAWQRLNTDPARPLFDRAALSTQPTGSTIKPFMALIGLEMGTLTPETTINCPGYFVYGGHVFHDDAAHGRVDLADAIRVSCNVYFFRAMMAMDFAKWTAWGHRFGFGEPFPTDIPTTAYGLWPDSSYFDRTYGTWTRGYLVSLGIGQGNLAATPLQLARYAAALANGGTLVTPHLARSLRNPETGEVVTPGGPRPQRLPITPEHMAFVREAMRNVVVNGTGRSVNTDRFAMAGKTGTAQNPHGEDHALFIAFAPYEDPQIAVAVFVENAGFGATAAAPIASLMAEQYLFGDIAPERRPLVERVINVVRSLDPTPTQPR